ncbi:hypothetical protein AA0114_g5452 [Alternaria tenuissima]|uniref:Uncharacterized protein n=1 Tax=Alternaria tenuissima TaxID=119927 RepID=A0A4Q4MJI2_9PLEO|nr:hypothetical protein AA0114_g5452 [Alternaria tenuissima]
MQIQAIVLLLVATVSSWQCFDHDEHFTTNHAQLAEGSDPNNQWGYCPSAKGCCADGKTWYACKNKCAGGAACSVSGGRTSC